MRRAGWGRICLITSYSHQAADPDPGPVQPGPDRAVGVGQDGRRRPAGPSGITLNLACPGTHATDRMKQLGGDPERHGRPRRLRPDRGFMCSEPAGFLSGAAVNVDGAAVKGLL